MGKAANKANDSPVLQILGLDVLGLFLGLDESQPRRPRRLCRGVRRVREGIPSHGTQRLQASGRQVRFLQLPEKLARLQ